MEEPIVPASLDAARVPSLEHVGDIPEGAVVNCAGGDDAAVPKQSHKKESLSEFLKTWISLLKLKGDLTKNFLEKIISTMDRLRGL